jgi:hypothetical protein
MQHLSFPDTLANPRTRQLAVVGGGMDGTKRLATREDRKCMGHYGVNGQAYQFQTFANARRLPRPRISHVTRWLNPTISDAANPDLDIEAPTLGIVVRSCEGALPGRRYLSRSKTRY